MEREYRGESLIAFPQNYTVIDIETTGYSPLYDEIIELSALKVRDNKIIDCFSSLVNNNGGIHINDFICELTGITQDMVDAAPDLREILPRFLDFISDDVVIGHNVSFDVNFIYDASMSIMGTPFKNDRIDTMRISRRANPDMSHHRLSDLSIRYSVDYSGSHRSLRDCEITKLCYDAMQNDILGRFESLNDFCNLKKKKYGVRSSDIVSDGSKIDNTHPLYKKTCVFTGMLEKMTRKEAMQIIADIGGINCDSVTKKTNFLILGCNDYCKSIHDGKSNKQKKAEQLRLSGQDISIISEDVFYDLIHF